MFDNFVARMFEFVFKSDRKAGINMIKESGYEEFAKYMADNKLISMKKSKKWIFSITFVIELPKLENFGSFVLKLIYKKKA